MANLRIVHGALTAGVLVLLGVFVFLRQSVSPAVPDLAGPLRLAGFVATLGAIVGFIALRGRIGPPMTGEDAETRSEHNAATALVLWTLLEGVAVLGVVFWYLTGDPVLWAAPTAIALVLLVAARPGVLLEP